ncbi:hypothetical protein CRE_09736 [Caenorhabditis remanei]|uniref:Tc1-like transposase DDE domain-containing protein n=1 Tax=Caenorhabditis remanei TaxID=31234 RepID=E3N4X6_CAERE|nr:hypothetical protein CRE_09736 [Caenorhabditis remanei]
MALDDLREPFLKLQLTIQSFIDENERKHKRKQKKRKRNLITCFSTIFLDNFEHAVGHTGDQSPQFSSSDCIPLGLNGVFELLDRIELLSMLKNIVQVLFSDEKKWNLDGPDGNRHYWRDLRKDPQLFSRRNFGGVSLMVWGGFCNGMKMKLQFITTRETSVSYQSTLQKPIVPFFRNKRRTHVFQQDNASIHKSISTQNWLKAQKITNLEWPAVSPDLSPIENLWGLLVRRVYKHGKQFNTIQELKDAVETEWNAITAAELRALVASMPNRMFEVIQKNGGETSY